MRLIVLVAVAAGFIVGCQRNAGAKPLLVSAAADLQDVFSEFGRRFEAEAGTAVEFNFAASGMLAQQIKSGARVDVFAAANIDFVNQLEAAGLILSDTKSIYAQGRLVALPRKDLETSIDSLADLEKPGVKRIAIANPVTAPYGIAASQALSNAGVWERLQSKLVYGENVRQTMELARSGNVDVALVSLSLTQQSPVKCYLVPPDLHKPIDQGIAVVKGAPSERLARRFVEMLKRDDGRMLLKKYGFSAVDSATPR